MPHCSVIPLSIVVCMADQPGAYSYGPTISEQLQLDPFRSVIQTSAVDRMIVVQTTTAEVYTRLWCCFEVYVALSERGDGFVQQAFSQQLQFPVAYHLLPKPYGSGEGSVADLGPESQSCVAKLRVISLLWATVWGLTALMVSVLPLYAAAVVFGVLWPIGISIVWSVAQWRVLQMNTKQHEVIQVDTTSAECSLASDTEMITEKIMAYGGFSVLDDAISRLRHEELNHFFTKRKLFMPISGAVQAVPPLVMYAWWGGLRLTRAGMLSSFLACSVGFYAYVATKIVVTWPSRQWF